IVAPELTAAGAAVSAFLIRSASLSASAGTTNVVRATAAPTVAENASFFMERPPFTFAMERHPSDDQRRDRRDLRELTHPATDRLDESLSHISRRTAGRHLSRVRTLASRMWLPCRSVG